MYVTCRGQFSELGALYIDVFYLDFLYLPYRSHHSINFPRGQLTLRNSTFVIVISVCNFSIIFNNFFSIILGTVFPNFPFNFHDCRNDIRVITFVTVISFFLFFFDMLYRTTTGNN